MLRKIGSYLVFCIVIALGLATFFSFFSSLNLAAESFLKSLARGQYYQAYGLCSYDFRSRVTYEVFTTVVEKNKLNDYSRIAWDKIYYDKDKTHASLSGRMQTNNNKEYWLTFEFVQVNPRTQNDYASGWEIDNIQVKALPSAATMPVPASAIPKPAGH